MDKVEELARLFSNLPVKKLDLSFVGDAIILADFIIHEGYSKPSPIPTHCKHDVEIPHCFECYPTPIAWPKKVEDLTPVEYRKYKPGNGYCDGFNEALEICEKSLASKDVKYTDEEWDRLSEFNEVNEDQWMELLTKLPIQIMPTKSYREIAKAICQRLKDNHGSI